MADGDALGLATAYVSARQWDQALAVLAPLVAADPGNVRALCLVASCHLRKGDPATALVAADAAAAAAPDEEWAARLQAMSQSALRRRRRARAAADRAVRLAPDNPETHRVRAEVDVAANWMTRSGKASAATLLRLDPRDAGLHVTAGNVWYVRGHGNKAEASYREALRLDSDNSAGLANLAKLSAERHRTGEAAQLLRGLLRSDPSSSDHAVSLRGVLSTVAIMAGIWSMLPIVLSLPGEGRATPGPGRLLVVLVVCLVAQGWHARRLHRSMSLPVAARFLLSGGGGRVWLLRLGMMLLAATDVALVVGLVGAWRAATGVAAAMTVTALLLCLASVLVVTASAVQMPRRRRR